jgi:aspartate-semialdehyde dehydrogenase
MGKTRVAILAATGMVGQRYVSMLSDHPFFDISCVTGLDSAGKRFKDAVKAKQQFPIGAEVGDLIVKPTSPEKVDADFVFSALPTEAAASLEPRFAEKGFKLITDASPHRMEADIPIIVPEVNPEHLDLIEWQRKRRKWSGFIVATPNCTAAGLALLLKPIDDFLKLRRVIVSTMQAVSGAGYPGVPSLDIIDNAIPYIKDEEEKVESEPTKILGTVRDGTIKNAGFKVSAMCHRIATTDGHMESAYVETEKEVDLGDVRRTLARFKGLPQQLRLPTAPTRPIIVDDRPDRPQVKLDRNAGSVPGMSVVVGRLRRGLEARSMRLTFLSHNTIRGAAGSTILAAELLWSRGMIA